MILFALIVLLSRQEQTVLKCPMFGIHMFFSLLLSSEVGLGTKQLFFAESILSRLWHVLQGAKKNSPGIFG